MTGKCYAPRKTDSPEIASGSVFRKFIPFYPGHQIDLLQSGEAFFSAIEAAFDQARHEIYLETYIYENDATGRRIADALNRAALRGVNVYMR